MQGVHAAPVRFRGTPRNVHIADLSLGSSPDGAIATYPTPRNTFKRIIASWLQRQLRNRERLRRERF